MSRLTFVSLFSGGGGADIGARDAGYELACGYELDPAIAEVANANLGQHVRVGNILDADPHDCPKPDLLHASPPCPNFSVAKAGRRETGLDLALADKVAEFIDVLSPRAFTLENVGQYEKSQSFQRIVAALNRGGYWLHWDVLNAADFAVPQTRRRLILRAVRGGLVPYLPAPLPWVGWYAAIEDLIPTLPESKFAEWQLARLPEAFAGEFYTVPQQSDDKKTERGYGCPRRSPDEPALTVTASQRPVWYKAFLMSKTADKYGDGLRMAGEPAHTIGANEHGSRAFLVGQQYDRPAGDPNRAPQIAGANEPAMTVTASLTSKGKMPHAFIINGREMHDYRDRNDVTLREGDAPIFTLSATSNPNRYKAFIVDGKPANYAGELQIVDADEPVVTVTSSQTRHPFRAWLSQGRVVAMTPRALARFQSIPDWYELPAKAGLACKIVGNAVASKMYQAVAEGLMP